MSLLKQLFLAICLFLVVAFAGSFATSLESSREQLLAQLRSHAQDAATALGLSLTTYVDDPAMLELMVSSIFDSGYFTSIRVVRLPDEQLLVERHADEQNRTVPKWFNQMVDLNPQNGDALIMRGWQQAARVEVQSSPKFALARLWDGALGMGFWLLLCGISSAVLGGILLRAQLKPLENMVLQAQAISRREFFSLPHLPRTPELKRVVLAMNQMVEKLKALFAEEAARSEKLRQEAYLDPLTGLANQRLFDTRLNNQLDASEHNSPGYLMLLKVNDLSGINQRHGGQHTDNLIRTLGQLLAQRLASQQKNDWLAARRRGGEFAVLAPGLASEEADSFAHHLCQSLENLRATGESDCTPVAHLGLAAYSPGDSLGSLLSRADQALAQAEQRSDWPWERVDEFSSQPLNNLNHWHQWLDDSLTEQRLSLFFQPVVHCAHPERVIHHKVLARIQNAQGELVSAGQFLPWVERLGWMARFDRVMLEQCLEHLSQHPRPLALSLSGASLREPKHCAELIACLRRYPALAGLLTLEIDEHQLPIATELGLFSLKVRDTGFSLGLQHFGGRFSLIGNLSQLGLAYLKIDGSYIRHLDAEPDKRPFIEALCRATHNIDLPLIAEMVEHSGELNVLVQLGVQGAMGRLIGSPAPWLEAHI